MRANLRDEFERAGKLCFGMKSALQVPSGTKKSSETAKVPPIQRTTKIAPKSGPLLTSTGGTSRVQCQKCQAMVLRTRVVRHVWQNHMGPDKCFKCLTCGAAFADADKMARHKSVHKGQLVKTHDYRTEKSGLLEATKALCFPEARRGEPLPVHQRDVQQKEGEGEDQEVQVKTPARKQR